MSCASRVLLALLLLTTALVGHPSVGATASSPVGSVGQTAEVAVLPPIAQPGARPADPAAARTVVTATFRPRLTNRPSYLEVRRAGRWSPVTSARLDAQGRVRYTARTRVEGRPAVYRVRASAYQGLPAVHTKPVRTDAWGSPTFVERFDGDALGPSWEHRIQFYNPWGGRSCSKGDPAAVAVGGGVLRLSALADPARTDELCQPHDPEGNPTSDGHYAWRLNGHVSTQTSFDFQYGVAAARMKFQRRRGQHAAFWMQPRGLLDYAPTPWGAEIDTIEWYGATRGRQRMATAVHRHSEDGDGLVTVGGPIADPDQYLAGDGDRWWRAYHVFSVEWTPHEYVFRIDGQETMRTSQGVSHHPEFLILSMLSSDHELDAPGIDHHLPQHMYVDWVQVWPTR
jgi:hypothetical protein